jgi:peptidyl-prolyl cis-trans isomerase C
MKWVYATTAILALNLVLVADASADKKPQKTVEASDEKKENQAQPEVDPTEVVAKIGDKEVIRLIDVLERIQLLPPQLKQAPLDQIYPNILQQMAMRVAIVKKAREKGIDKSVEYKKALQEMQLNLLQEMYLFAGQKESYTDDDLKKEYEGYLKEFVAEDQVRARHILVKDEKEAQGLIEQIKEGDDFAKLAEKHSLDHLSAKRGGDLDFFGKNDLIQEFTKVAFDMKDGELLEKPVKTQFGFHVIKREGGRKKEASPFEKAKASVLPNRIRQREIQARMKEATDTHKVELFNMDGSPLKMPEPENADKAGVESEDKSESSKTEVHSENAESEAHSNHEAEALGEEVGEEIKE